MTERAFIWTRARLVRIQGIVQRRPDLSVRRCCPVPSRSIWLLFLVASQTFSDQENTVLFMLTSMPGAVPLCVERFKWGFLYESRISGQLEGKAWRRRELSWGCWAGKLSGDGAAAG
jgi:hypothetical protein